ncbi:hypothetical protein [Streptomyces sp. NPDC052107]|uniref:hypothetical protein n=1 Tax=Streptomyces sp. NPDC052107 TaxID=3155632 RepID=UPI00343D0E82
MVGAGVDTKVGHLGVGHRFRPGPVRRTHAKRQFLWVDAADEVHTNIHPELEVAPTIH